MALNCWTRQITMIPDTDIPGLLLFLGFRCYLTSDLRPTVKHHHAWQEASALPITGCLSVSVSCLTPWTRARKLAPPFLPELQLHFSEATHGDYRTMMLTVTSTIRSGPTRSHSTHKDLSLLLKNRMDPPKSESGTRRYYSPAPLASSALPK